MDILVMHSTYPTNEEFSRDKVFFFFFFLENYYNSETLNSVSTLVKEICQQPMHYTLTNSLDNFVTNFKHLILKLRRYSRWIYLKLNI